MFRTAYLYKKIIEKRPKCRRTLLNKGSNGCQNDKLNFASITVNLHQGLANGGPNLDTRDSTIVMEGANGHYNNF